MVLKTAAQAFEAGDFLSIFLTFLGFWGSLPYALIKRRVFVEVLPDDRVSVSLETSDSSPPSVGYRLLSLIAAGKCTFDSFEWFGGI